LDIIEESEPVAKEKDNTPMSMRIIDTILSIIFYPDISP